MNPAQPSTLAKMRGLSGRPLFQRTVNFALRDTNVVVISVVLNNVLRALSSVVLTRLLVPEVFGIAGIISSILFTFAMVSDLGFQPFVVRHPDGDDPRFLDTVWTVALLRSLFLTAAAMVTAPAVAALFGKHELAPIIEIAALTFVIEGVGSLTFLTALRHRKVLQLSVLELAVYAVQIVISIILAYYWRNYWAILVAVLISTAFKSLLTYVVFPNPIRRLSLDRRYISELWKFARFVTGSSIITVLLMQSDKLVLARLMPLDHFGFYLLAGNLAGAPLAFSAAYGARVLFPYYSQSWREGRDDLRNLLYEKRRIPSLLYSLGTGILIGSAPLIVAILYDPRYATASTYFQILAVSALFSLTSNAGNEALVATGRVGITFQANVAKFVWFVIAAPAGHALWGVTGLVAAVGLMEVPSVLFKWFQLKRVALLDWKQELLFLGACVPGLALGMAMDAVIRPYLT